MRTTAVSEEQSSKPGSATSPAKSGMGWLKRRWPQFRPWLSILLLGAAIGLGVGKAHDLADAAGRLSNLRWGWLIVAVVFEAASMVIFARIQRWLLRAGGVRLDLRTMVEITLAGNALGLTLPGGVAWSGAWVFGQLRRRGADRVLAVWVLLVAGAISSFALFVVVALGIEVAGSSGPVRNLRLPAIALALIPVAGAVLLTLNRRSGYVKVKTEAFAAWFSSHFSWGRRAEDTIGSVVERIETVRLSPWEWAEVLGLALLNWIDDCACLIACMMALHISVPWRAILVIYGITQISASLPITPGGLGVVEGSLAVLLTAYGVNLQSALATVILYRIVSFWAVVPIGWGFWAYLDLRQRRGKRAGRAHPWAAHGNQGVTDRRSTAPKTPALLRSPQSCADCPESSHHQAKPVKPGPV